MKRLGYLVWICLYTLPLFLMGEDNIQPTQVTGINFSQELRQKRIAEIDKDLAKLREDRKRYKALETAAGYDASRVQFQSWMDYKVFLAQEERYKRKVEELDQMIKNLEKEKATLLGQ